MAVVARDARKQYTPAPAGLWSAVCLDMRGRGMFSGGGLYAFSGTLGGVERSPGADRFFRPASKAGGRHRGIPPDYRPSMGRQQQHSGGVVA